LQFAGFKEGFPLHRVRSKKSAKISQHKGRFVVLGMLGAYLALILGIPIPHSTSKESGERFPCENCACSCSSASYCWDKCCCHTDAEKLAWAARNHVEPPRFLVERVARAKRSELQKIATLSGAAKRTCSCCSRKPSAPDPSVSAKTHAPSDPAASTGTKADRRSLVRVVMLDPALQCLGVRSGLLLCSGTWIPELEPTVVAIDELCLDWLVPVDEECFSREIAPDGPVPWFEKGTV
jgi:hypothetical protein